MIPKTKKKAYIISTRTVSKDVAKADDFFVKQTIERMLADNKEDNKVRLNLHAVEMEFTKLYGAERAAVLMKHVTRPHEGTVARKSTSPTGADLYRETRLRIKKKSARNRKG